MTTALDRYNSRMNWKFMHKVNGIPYTGTEERFKEIQNMEIKTDDIAIVTYPKCGTTWVQQILCYLRDDSALDQIQKQPWAPLEVVVPGMLKTPIQMVEQMTSPRIVVTHLPFELCPPGLQHGQCKIIYVVRNPKDVAVSFFHFHKTLGYMCNMDDFPWNDFLEVYAKTNQMFSGSWFEHVKNWLPHREKENVLFITFEELKKDPTKGIKKMAAFLERDISLERAKGIAELCDFKRMRSDAETRVKADGGKSPVKATSFVRKGQVGDWKNYFTVAQNEMFDGQYKQQMENIDLDIEFEI